jgi:hypothetical protein
MVMLWFRPQGMVPERIRKSPLVSPGFVKTDSEPAPLVSAAAVKEAATDTTPHDTEPKDAQ